MNSLLNINKPRTVLTIALFLIGQWFAIAHAAEHGVGPHEHNGVVCSIQLHNEDDASLANNHLVSFAPYVTETNCSSLSGQAFLSENQAARPPPTGPPSL